MKKILITLIVCLTLCGCGDKENKDFTKDVEGNSVKELMQNNDYIIIDVRTKEEFSESHVKDAINIPYDEIDENTDIDKDKLVFVYCKSGNRSGKAYNTLKSLGFNVYDLGAFNSIDLPKE